MSDLKMDRRMKREWLEALRSGKYEQGKGKLVTYVDDKPKYCCLGVLCEVVDLKPEHIFQLDGSIGFLNHDTTLPLLVARGTGLNSSNPIIPVGQAPWGGTNGISLAELNDGDFTFAQIADLIDYFIEAER